VRALAAIALSVAACGGGAALPVQAPTCGDRACIAHGYGGQAICDVADMGGMPAPEPALCQWDGARCSGIACTASRDCGAGNSCFVPSVPTGSSGFCVRGAGAVADRTACTRDEDCMPEPCCRPTMCVNRADAVCRSSACCACQDCERCISGCRCVNGCCVTDRAALDPGHCC
jgi:hypothetical protein